MVCASIFVHVCPIYPIDAVVVVNKKSPTRARVCVTLVRSTYNVALPCLVSIQQQQYNSGSNNKLEWPRASR